MKSDIIYLHLHCIPWCRATTLQI